LSAAFAVPLAGYAFIALFALVAHNSRGAALSLTEPSPMP
jgi:hypothetical protein